MRRIGFRLSCASTWRGSSGATGARSSWRRVARPEEIARAVVFFASPLADYITGQTLSVSGGLTMC